MGDKDPGAGKDGGCGAPGSDASKDPAALAVHQTEERFRQALRHTRVVVFDQDRDLRYTRLYNPVPKYRDALGLTDRDVVQPEEAARLDALKHRVFESGDEVREEVELTFDGVRHRYDIVAEPIRDAAGEMVGVACTAMDVTERWQAEEERRALDRRLREAERLESLGLLAGGIAHDFSNILMTIATHADLALEELPPETLARGDVEQIRRAAARAGELCRQLLTYAGRRTPATRPVDLSQTAREVAELLAVRIPPAVTLELALEAGLPRIVADEVQLRQALMNLLTNAVEAIGEGTGRVTMSTGAGWFDRDQLDALRLGERLPAGRYAWCSVADTGCGMSEAVQARIFDPFFTTRPSGRGLGLATVLGVVKGHGGALGVDSEPGRGTTFRVLLPSDGATAGAPPG